MCKKVMVPFNAGFARHFCPDHITGAKWHLPGYMAIRSAIRIVMFGSRLGSESNIQCNYSVPFTHVQRILSTTKNTKSTKV